MFKRFTNFSFQYTIAFSLAVGCLMLGQYAGFHIAQILLPMFLVQVLFFLATKKVMSK